MSVASPLSGLISSLAALALLTGCQTGHPPGPDDYYPPVALPVQPSVPARDAFSLEVAERMCGIESLNRQYQSYRTELRDMRSGPASPYHSPETHSSESSQTIQEEVSRPSPGPQTAQVELVRTLELDIDASYRFATATCQNYAVCMYQHRYAEQACRYGRDAWQRAQDRFEAMSGRIAETRVELARIARPAYTHRPGRRPADTGSARCDDRMGGIFSTAGCRP